MNILISGGYGFIASHLVERLVADDHKVFIIDDLSNGKLENLSNVKDKVKTYHLDVSILNNINWLPKIDVIYSLHCYPRSLSFYNPQRDTEVNVIGNINLIKLAQQHKAKVIFCSNSGIYGEHTQLPIDEFSQDRPLAPYDLSKLIVEHYLRLYHKTFGIPYVTLRLGTVYGLRQNLTADWKPVIRYFINQIQKGEMVEIHGEGNQTRDFIYVKDVVEALVKSMTCEEAIGETMIISTGKETSIMQLFQTICKLMGKNASFCYAPRRLDDIQRMCYSNRKAMKILGWKPHFSLQQGIKEMLQP